MKQDLSEKTLDIIRSRCNSDVRWKTFFTHLGSWKRIPRTVTKTECMDIVAPGADPISRKRAWVDLKIHVLEQLDDMMIGELHAIKGPHSERLSYFLFYYDARQIANAIDNPNMPHAPIAALEFEAPERSEVAVATRIIEKVGKTAEEALGRVSGKEDEDLKRVLVEVISMLKERPRETGAVTMTITINGRMSREEADYWAARISLMGE